jgi:hypothetical protein
MECVSKTGSYRYVGGKVVKVSDRIPPISSRQDGVYFKEPYYENFGGAGNKGGVEITGKAHKKREMEKRGIREFEESNAEVKQETRGKIVSFPGQKHCDRNKQNADYSSHVAKMVSEQ